MNDTPRIIKAAADAIRVPEFRQELASRLSAVVKVPTVVHNGMGLVGTDPAWDIFYNFEKVLEREFPLVHKSFKLTKINTHGRLYSWKGSEEDLKPLLFMAHSDVVPIDSTTIEEWIHDPFSGHFDGDFVWGRGSIDDKSNLIAILSTMEVLLSRKFKPRRSILISVGFDEEGGSWKSQGARCLGEHLINTLGPDSIEMIIDEGVTLVEEHEGIKYAHPGTAEKGYVDVIVKVKTSGGHSSMPPEHTCVGLLARAVTLAEDYAMSSTPTSECDHTQFFDEPSRFESQPSANTTTAVTVFHGGEISNAVPDSAYAIINHRIGVTDTVRTVKAHYVSLFRPLADRFDLNFSAFGDSFPITSSTQPTGSLILTTDEGYDLDPSPVSSTSDVRYTWLTEAIGTVFGEDTKVVPALLQGNTDTRYYWPLSPQIYRISPYNAKHDPREPKYHTVDERMPIEGLLEMSRFYLEIIRICDEMRR